MKATLSGLILLAVFAGSARTAGCSRLSWGTCDPWIESKHFAGPASYVLVWSIAGVGDANTGLDGNIHIGEFGSGPVADCWRFDDAGCQTGSQLHLSASGFSKSCAVFQGANPVILTNYSLDASKSADLRLAETYDAFTPSAASRYTAWVITFDHSFSSVGPTPPDQSTCGGAEQCEGLNLSHAAYLTTGSQVVNMPSCDIDWYFPPSYWIADSPGSASGFALWNDCFYDKTQSSTWGRLKGLYR